MARMMKYIFITLTLLFSFNAYADVDANAPVVKEAVSAFMQQHQIPGVAVLLYVNGEPHAYYFGYANRETKMPVTDKTIFELGSLSKIMTGLLFAQQIDVANVQPTDSVTTYLPDLSEYFDAVSLRSLATNTSGLPFNAPPFIRSEGRLWDYLDEAALPYIPHKQWVYSNMGIGLLGKVLETVTHKNINDLYLKYILMPLNMQPIGISVPAKLVSYYAQGYDKYGQPAARTEVGIFPAAWGVKMSADDMLRFLGAAVGIAQTPETIFYPMRLTQAEFVKLPDRMQGLGWQIFPLKAASIRVLLNPTDIGLGPVTVSEIYDKPNYDNHALMDKSGATNGFRAYIAVLPDKKSGIAILTNRYVNSDAIVRTGREILFKLTKLD